jgi:RHS repeat-associated protein
VWQWHPDPFGKGDPSGTFTYDLRFPGQFFDQATRLHYNYFRDYDPRLGRYIESDPVGLAGGINSFLYAGGNPVASVDFFGLIGGTFGVTLPGGTVQITVGKEGAQVTGGEALPGGLGANGGLGTFQPPTPSGVINGQSEITITIPFFKIICDLEKQKLKVKPNLKVGLGISGGTTQTSTSPVIPWSQILPPDSPLYSFLTNPNSFGPLAPYISGYK